MGWTKRQFILEAFDEIGLASYVFDLTPDQLQSALYRLDSMMAEWNGKGIRLGYPLPSSPQNSNIDEQTNVPDSANEAIYTNLGIKLAPTYGKQVMPETKSNAKRAYNTLLARSIQIIEYQFPGTLPLGAGNKPWRSYDDPFVRQPVETLNAGEDGVLEFN